jgi:hypothetical protein
MKLSLINESNREDREILSRQAEFETVLLYEPEFESMENYEILDYCTKQFTTNTPPGITPINAKVICADTKNVDDDRLFKAVFVTSIEDFIRNSIEYDNDVYDILDGIKVATHDKSIMAAANRFMRDKSNNFKVAKIGGGNEISDIDVTQQF